MLTLPQRAYLEILGHAYDGLPDEACGLLLGRGATVVEFLPCENADASSRTFSIGKACWEAAAQREADGLDVVGVVHSHTHTEAYPSPTDVDKGSNPLLAGWRWVIVSLRHEAPVLRAYLVDDGTVREEAVAVLGR